MITYNSRTGEITLNDNSLGFGYSGRGTGMNVPAVEAIEGVGPIPKGDWKITRWDDQHGDKGPCVAVLSPLGHNAHGRSGFLIHGDNSHMDHSASHGCIIASKTIRQELRDGGQTLLKVI